MRGWQRLRKEKLHLGDKILANPEDLKYSSFSLTTNSTLMKKILILVFVGLMFGLSLLGQTMDNPGTPEERAQKMTEMMKKTLPLDTTQVDTIHALNLKYAKMGQKEIIEPQLGIWGKYRKGTQLTKQKEKELKVLLSKSQWDNYLKQKAIQRKKIMKQLFE